MYHKAYQEYLRTHSKAAAYETMVLNYPAEGIGLTPANRYSIEASYSTLTEMLNHSITGRYEIAQIQTAQGVRAAIEVPIQINVKNFSLSATREVPVIYVGYIDVILYDNLTGSYVVMDIKTTSSNVKDISPEYRFAEQCMPYAMVLERILGHPLTNFRVLYFSVYVDLGDPSAKLFEFPKSDLDIQEWVRGFAIDLKLIRSYYRMGWFKREPKRCMDYRRPCTFYDFCESRNEENILNQLALREDAKEEEPIIPWFTMDLDIEGLEAA